MEEFCSTIYHILKNNQSAIEGNTFIDILDYGDIDLNFKGVHYRLKPMKMDEEV